MISSRGKEEMRRVLKGFGGKSTKATVTMVVTCMNGRVQGSRWMILGGAGKPDLRVKELTGGEEEWKLKLNLTDLSIFQFNDNGAKANFTQWVEGKTLVEKMKAKVGEKLTDRSNIDNKTRLKSKVFSLVSFWSPPPSLRQRVKYDGWDRETGVGGPFLNLGVA